MALSDPLGDMLTRIRNGQQARKATVNAPASKLRENVLDVLQRRAGDIDLQSLLTHSGFSFSIFSTWSH